MLADAPEDYPYDCALITLNAAGAVMDDTADLDIARAFQPLAEKEMAEIRAAARS